MPDTNSGTWHRQRHTLPIVGEANAASLGRAPPFCRVVELTPVLLNVIGAVEVVEPCARPRGVVRFVRLPPDKCESIGAVDLPRGVLSEPRAIPRHVPARASKRDAGDLIRPERLEEPVLPAGDGAV